MWESLNLCHFPRGYGMAKHGNVVVAFSTPISCGCGHLDSYSYSQQVHAPPYAVKYRIGRRSFVSGDTCEYISLLTSSGLGQRQLRHNNYRLSRSGRARIRAAIDFASAVDVINDLGLDTLTFLAVIVAVLPTFKLLRASPILGFFFAGVVLNQFGFIRNLTDVKVLSEWGILFLIIGLIFNRGSKIHRYPGTGEYDKYFEEGVYNCAGCGTPLYRSTTKFNSGCGWPAFFEGLPGAITSTLDPDGMRTEITCTACGGHLGHVFKGEGFPTPTDERHCVNSISLKFVLSTLILPSKLLQLD